MFSLVHYILLEKPCIAQNLQNGFMKESGTYFIFEFNNFFLYNVFFFFFSKRISLNNISFLYLFIFIIS